MQKQRLNNDLDQPFDLDEYIEEKSFTEAQEQFDPETEDSESRTKNIIMFVGVLLVGAFWFFNANSIPFMQNIFGSGNSHATIAPPAPSIDVQIPDINVDINIPDFNFDQASSGSSAITEFLAELKELGLLDDGKLSVFEATQIHAGGVPVGYLQELDNRGFINRFSFVEITEFWNNRVPLEYLESLDELGFLDRFSFVETTEFYKNRVSFEYLQTLDKAGYLDQLSFVYITEYYKNGVTVEFLNELKEKGLYDQMNFIEVVETFKQN